MKGGIFALSEMFVKILSIASVALVLLAIFLALNQVAHRRARQSLRPP